MKNCCNGGHLLCDGQDFPMVGFLPIGDVTQIVGLLSAMGGNPPPDPDADGVYSVDAGGQEIFLTAKGGRPPETIVQMIDMPDTRAQTESFVSYWRKAPNVIVALKPFTSWQGDLDDVRAKGWDKDLSTLNRRTCDRLWMWLTVFADGRLATCCRDYDGS